MAIIKTCHKSGIGQKKQALKREIGSRDNFILIINKKGFFITYDNIILPRLRLRFRSF